MKDICNDAMGSGYLNSDWNQGNILNFGIRIKERRAFRMLVLNLKKMYHVMLSIYIHVC